MSDGKKTALTPTESSSTTELVAAAMSARPVVLRLALGLKV